MTEQEHIINVLHSAKLLLMRRRQGNLHPIDFQRLEQAMSAYEEFGRQAQRAVGREGETPLHWEPHPFLPRRAKGAAPRQGV